jgi:ABC-type Mn2+/Zn2+ transport system ATPase subunit
MNDDTLRFNDVTVCYGRTPAVHHLSGELRCGSLVALMGPNGAGKSTLLRAILGWHRLTTGSITVAGKPCRHARARIGYLPQRTAIDWDFPVTVREVVEMGRYQCLGPFRAFADADREAVDAALEEMGLGWLQDRQIAALSGGQQQRTFLARAVASGADIFLLDEPFAGLDPVSTSDLVKRLRTWAQQGRLVLTVVHDVSLARTFFQEAMLIRTHLIASGPVTTVLDDRNLAEAYGSAYPSALRIMNSSMTPALPDFGGLLRGTMHGSVPVGKIVGNPSTNEAKP